MAAKISRLFFSCSSTIVTPRSFNVSHQFHLQVRSSGSYIRPSLFPSTYQPYRMASADSAAVSPVEKLGSVELEPSATVQDEVVLENAPSNVVDDKKSEEIASGTTETTTPSNNSSTTPDGDLTKRQYEPRVKKVKAAILLSYCGQGYFGMQMQNSGARTIENDLLQAFLDAKVVDEEGFQKPKSIKFQRAARTDKNVSAARNIISVMVPKTFDPDAVNQFLPDQIRVMDWKKVTKSFDAKVACNARTYLYMIPTFAFVPLEGKVREDYRVTPEVLANLRRLLKLYLGTKNFHNFTSGKKPSDPSAVRYIMSFESSDPFVQDGLEFVVLKVKGQSFMLHQIRKMIGLVLAILRGFTSEETVANAFTLKKVDVPMAPGLGLMLGETHYDHYNRKFGNDGIHEPINWDNVAEKIEKFCQEKIYYNVTKTENEEKSMFNWLTTLQFHTFEPREYDGDSKTGYGPLGRAYLQVKRERGEDADELDLDEDQESDDEEMSRKKRRSN